MQRSPHFTRVSCILEKSAMKSGVARNSSWRLTRSLQHRAALRST
jgi:hypothetical protein